MKPLDQVRSTGAYAPDHTAKVHNKFDTRRSILEELRAFASSVPDFRRLDKGNIRHRLDDIIMLMILGRMVAGCIGRAEIYWSSADTTQQITQNGHVEERGAIRGHALPCGERHQRYRHVADRMQQFAQIFLDRLLNACRVIEIICA